MSFSFGNNIKITLFGQSHGQCIGVVIDGLPKGLQPDMDNINAFLARRSPLVAEGGTPRKEPDSVEFISGLFNGRTSESPLVAVIANKDTKSDDYRPFLPRPSHADYAAFVKYGKAFDYRGAGSFSGRMTAPLCVVGALCSQCLIESGIVTGFHIASIGEVQDSSFDSVALTWQDLMELKEKTSPVIDEEACDNMKAAVMQARAEGDSLGGVIECAAVGVPAGLGEPIFQNLESEIASAVFAIPAVKGIEFGSGFAGTRLKGSENNDEFILDANKAIKTATNNHGGILGGISTGMPIVFKVAFKPTPSIAKEQKTVNMITQEEMTLNVRGRHDACIAWRAGICVEAVLNIVLLDMFLNFKKEI